MVKISNIFGRKGTCSVIMTWVTMDSSKDHGGNKNEKENSGYAAYSGNDLRHAGRVWQPGDSSKEASGSGNKKGDGDTLTVMCVGTEADTYIDAYNSIAEKFSEDNEYGVKVKMDFYENEQYKTKLTTLMASNAVPDVFLPGNCPICSRLWREVR